MDIVLHIDKKTALILEALANEREQTIDTFALEVLRNALATPHCQQWPLEVLSFQGIPEMPAFESYRSELSGLQDDPLA